MKSTAEKALNRFQYIDFNIKVTLTLDLSDQMLEMAHLFMMEDNCFNKAFNVSTLSVQSRLFTYLPYSNNHGFSRVPFSMLKNQLFRRCLKSMIYETISVKYYLYFGVSKQICLFFGKGSYFKLNKIGVWK